MPTPNTSREIEIAKRAEALLLSASYNRKRAHTTLALPSDGLFIRCHQTKTSSAWEVGLGDVLLWEREVLSAGLALLDKHFVFRIAHRVDEAAIIIVTATQAGDACPTIVPALATYEGQGLTDDASGWVVNVSGTPHEYGKAHLPFVGAPYHNPTEVDGLYQHYLSNILNAGFSETWDAAREQH